MPNTKHNLKITRKQFREITRDRHFGQRSLAAAQAVMCSGLTYEEAGNMHGMSKQQVWGIVKDLRASL